MDQSGVGTAPFHRHANDRTTSFDGDPFSDKTKQGAFYYRFGLFEYHHGAFIGHWIDGDELENHSCKLAVCCDGGGGLYGFKKEFRFPDLGCIKIDLTNNLRTLQCTVHTIYVSIRHKYTPLNRLTSQNQNP